MPSKSGGGASGGGSANNKGGPQQIDKLDFPAPTTRTPLLGRRNDDGDDEDDNNDNDGAWGRTSSLIDSRHGGFTGSRGQFFEDVAEGIQERDRELFKREVTRYISFAWAIISCLCAGSITAFSLYAPLFQTRLHYSQFQVNMVSIVAELALYLPVPLIGLLCDRRGPGLPSLLSAFLFGGGYLLAAAVYRQGSGDTAAAASGLPFLWMCLAFVGIGVGTGCMYLGAVSTCAKNFGRSKHKGFALAAPIASFGMGGMWQSQVGSRLIYERGPEGQHGDVDVFRYFVFLAGLLLSVGIVGSLLLRVVDEAELVAEAVEDLERSGLLDENFFGARADVQRVLDEARDYGTMGLPPDNLGDDDDDESDNNQARESLSHSRPHLSRPTTRASSRLTSSRQRHPSADARAKSLLVNIETKRFLADHTMWWLAAGFFLVTGPGEAFINNMGTIIGTLSQPGEPSLTSPATSVGIVAVTSTIARMASGALSDLLAPVVPRHQYLQQEQRRLRSGRKGRRFTVSRITLLLGASLILALAFALLASGAAQDRAAATLFPLVTGLVGAGYGAVFSLVPIVISCVWGVENFATNWGIVAMAPAGGAAAAGLAYAAVYEAGVDKTFDGDASGAHRCYGSQCYRTTAVGFLVSVVLAMAMWLWAWRGRGGWRARGIAV